MNLLESGKAKIGPLKIKRFNYKNTHYSNPIINVTCLSGNTSFTLINVNRKYFEIENNTNETISINYIINKKSKISPQIETVQQSYVTSLGDEIINLNQDENGFYNQFSFNFSNMFEHSPDDTVTYTVESFVSNENPELASFYSNSIFISDEGIIDLNPDIYSELVSIEITVKAAIGNLYAIAKKTINYIAISSLYTVSEIYNINYTSPSDLTPGLTKSILYTSGTSEDLAAFIIPTASLQQSDSYFTITPDLTSSPLIDLILLSNDTVYFTNNPDDPSLDQTTPTLYDGYVSYSFRIKLVTNTTYYFWLDTNTQTWYYSTERFPNAN